MATIRLDGLRHSYLRQPREPADWALKRLDVAWADGGAFALLGPSGCGKSTLLNIISGIVQPSEGRVLFGDEDVTSLPTDRRNIAQVFQFPVVYDTMTVHDNLAFPLRNRGVASEHIAERVRDIAAMLELDGLLDRRAAGLAPDIKQKLSMGRGLVRDDVNAIMFDEPLTVIDPHLKWRLRSKLKELHERVRVTMIYVTHDQTEALTFADQVIVMQDGEVVQIGTPIELFEKPQHTFVGHFIGSPGMNVMPCEVRDGAAFLAGQAVATETPATPPAEAQRLEVGVRPEYVRLADEGLEAEVVRVADAGRHRVVEARLGGDIRIDFLSPADTSAPMGPVRLSLEATRTRLYADGWLVDGNRGA